jgi:hypothetical protein
MLISVKFNHLHMGYMSTQITTIIQQSILGLSLEPILLDDKITIYFVCLIESEEKFNFLL